MNFDEILKNRLAQEALRREAAMRGDPIAGALFELESWASQDPAGRFIVDSFNYRDKDELDDERPY